MCVPSNRVGCSGFFSMTITAPSCINICLLLLLFITLLLSFNDVSANPNKVKCDLIGKANNKNVMTQTTIMGATPTDATDLIAFSSDTYSKGSEQITVTLFLQILGFIFAILMVEENGGVHFNSNVIHTIIGLVVVILGTLQPLNAMFRMHPPADGWPNGVKPMKRKLFEWVHKGSGRIATILGILNVGIGVILVRAYGFDDSVTTVATIFSILGIVPVITFFVGSTMKPNNKVAKFIVGASKDDGKDSNMTKVVPTEKSDDLEKRIQKAWSVEEGNI